MNNYKKRYVNGKAVLPPVISSHRMGDGFPKVIECLWCQVFCWDGDIFEHTKDCPWLTFKVENE